MSLRRLWTVGLVLVAAVGVVSVGRPAVAGPVANYGNPVLWQDFADIDIIRVNDTYYYSTDGVNFTALGPGFTLNNAWQFFMGYRFAVFNYAIQALCGAVTLQRFELSTP